VNPLTSVVLLWTSERDMKFWTPYSDGPREHNSKILTYNRWCALPLKKALATRSPYSLLPKYTFLDLPQDVICSVARFRLRVHTLRFETATWSRSSSPTCGLCKTDDVQDEQHAIFHCTHPHTVSLRRRYESLFSEMTGIEGLMSSGSVTVWLAHYSGWGTLLDCPHEHLVRLRTQQQLTFPPQFEDLYEPAWYFWCCLFCS
jgi:hypothetical protein